MEKTGAVMLERSQWVKAKLAQQLQSSIAFTERLPFFKNGDRTNENQS